MPPPTMVAIVFFKVVEVWHCIYYNEKMDIHGYVDQTLLVSIWTRVTTGICGVYVNSYIGKEKMTSIVLRDSKNNVKDPNSV